jgi:response regulator RpfG family c-di-GMP phosphodiesterase
MTDPVHRPVILSVDDEPSISEALRLSLRVLGADFLSATSGREALELLEDQKVDVILSDMRMPQMDGVEFLHEAAQRQPAARRILLSGNTDADSAVRAVNEGGICAYITKPWDDERLRALISELLERQSAERERQRLEQQIAEQNHVLEKLNAELEQRVAARTEELRQEHARLELAYTDLLESHHTTVNLLASVVSLRDPEGCSDLESKKALAVAIAREIDLDDERVMIIEQAMALHRIGLMGVTDHALHQASESLKGEELERVHRHPLQAEALLMGIPHLVRVAEILRSEHERFDGLGFPDGIGAEEIPLGSRILAVARDFHDLMAGRLLPKELMPADALAWINKEEGHRYDPFIVAAFRRVHQGATHLDTSISESMLRSATLETGMRLSRDLLTPEGLLLLNKNQLLTAGIIGKIKRLEETFGRPLEVFVRRDTDGG